MLLFVAGCCRSATSISMTSEMDLHYLNSSEAHRVFVESNSGLNSNGTLSLSDRFPLLFKVVGIKNRFLCSIACGSCLLGYKVSTSTSDSKIAEVIRSVCDL